MTAFTTEKTGTVSLTAGSAAVSGASTLFALRACAGGILIVNGVAAAIASVESDTAATLEQAWPGSTVAGSSYVIARSTASAARLVNAQDKLADLVDKLESQFFFEYDAFGTALADRDGYDGEAEGFKFALLPAAGTGGAVLYVRDTAVAGVWTGGVEIRGATGATGAAGADGQALDFRGAGVPSDALGVDGQTYLDISNGDTYLKAAGTWGAPSGSIKGDQGDQGIQGIQGLKGDTGDDGQAFDFRGAGVPSNGLGVDGQTYLDIANGDTYLKAAGTWGAPVGSVGVDLDSPAFLGEPTAPTAAPGTDTGQLATTGFVAAGLALKLDLDGGNVPDGGAELRGALGAVSQAAYDVALAELFTDDLQVQKVTTAVSYVEFDVPAGGECFMLIGMGIRHTNDGNISFQTAAVATFASGGTDYDSKWLYSVGVSSPVPGTVQSGAPVITSNTYGDGSAGLIPVQFSGILFAGNANVWPSFLVNSSYYSVGDDPAVQQTHVYRRSVGRVGKLRFGHTGGTFTRGTFILARIRGS